MKTGVYRHVAFGRLIDMSLTIASRTSGWAVFWSSGTDFGSRGHLERVICNEFSCSDAIGLPIAIPEKPLLFLSCGKKGEDLLWLDCKG